MIQQILFRRLDKLGRRYRYLRIWQGLSLVWLVAAVAGCLFWAWREQSAASATAPVVALAVAAFLLAGSAIALGFRAARNYSWLAQQVESAYPELRTCLLVAVEQQPELPEGQFGYLQTSVIWQALDHSRRHRWAEIVTMRRLATAAATCLLAFMLFGAALGGMMLSTDSVAGPVPSSKVLAKGATGPETSMTVEPGDAEIERGTSLLVLARIQGPMPAQATLHYQFADGSQASLPMSPSLDDPVMSGRIPLVEQPLEYHVALADIASPRYHVTVFEYPRLERADAHLVFPTYTGLEDRLIQDVRTVSVVEGTQLTLRCYLNKPVASAVLSNAKAGEAGDKIVLTPQKSQPLLYEATIDCQQSRRLKLELRDERGRKEQKTEQFTIHVLPNQPPSIKPTFPARDLEVSALEEMDVKAAVVDDYGVRRLGLSYSLAGQPTVEVVLAERAAARQKHELAHLLTLEALKAQPDQLLSYYWWAEDLDARGQPRRTSSDMYFAEIRPFEEVFRQGEQPPGQQQKKQPGQSPNAADAQELARLQKDIVSATWKLIRREAAGPLSAAFPEDVEQVRLSQMAAIEKATALAEKLQDEQSQAHMEDVLKHMQAAAEQLAAAHDGPDLAPLTPALSAEQAAYQALLKLRAREHEVTRQQQGQPGSQSASRSQQQREQMQQLDLQQEENRYETQRTAEEQQQESAEDRENRQVLNRLRELARRQHDLNERLKELQSALEEAKSPEEKDEIRRQLQRLQDEQRQILQDTDELQSRLAEPQNQDRVAQERQQLDQTRDQVRRASEALEQQRVGQAAAAGTRAEQEFDELREEFRRRASQHFQQEMQEMRQAARELEKKEQGVAESIRAAAEPKPGAPTLREEDHREQITEQLADQRQRLSSLQDQMRDTIERAEPTEPILSQRLYDTARSLRDQSIDKALQTAERSIRQGLTGEAQKQEAAAGEGVRQVREGIERAAEGVLGDGTEALRRARNELQHLSGELAQEVRRNTEEPGDKGQKSEVRGQKSEVGDRKSGGEQPLAAPLAERGKSEVGGQKSEVGGQKSEVGGQKPEGGGQKPEGGNQKSEGLSQRGSQRASGGPGAPGPFEDFVPGDAAPLTGERFREWSDRLRDVEEMVDDPELRGDAARIRERARAMRAEFKRHSTPPHWDLVREQISRPLNELQQRVAEELLRRTSKKALVPLDRDPVPPQYSEKSRRYYERLGSGK